MSSFGNVVLKIVERYIGVFGFFFEEGFQLEGNWEARLWGRARA